MKKISLVYVKDLTVLGDRLIYETAKYLLTKIALEENWEFSYKECGLFPDKKDFKDFKIFEKKLKQVRMCIDYKFMLLGIENFKKSKLADNVFFLCKFLYWNFYKQNRKLVKEHYNNICNNSDLVFFCGGGIFQQFYMNMWTGIFAIVNNCSKNNIPVYFNAIGLEPSPRLIERMLYKYLLNQKVVKAITTRDDIEHLKTLVSKCEKVIDPALWIPECFSVKKPNSNVIGIGLIRPKIFDDNLTGVSEDEVPELYIGIIKELEKRGYNWQLFSNGGWNDYNFGLELIEKLGCGTDKLAKFPETTSELINCIKNYKGIIAGRMHAVIAAISLDIPTLGIVWAKKFLHLQRDFKLNNFITPDMFSNPSVIVDEFEKTLNSEIDTENKNRLKEYSYKLMKEKLKEIDKET